MSHHLQQGIEAEQELVKLSPRNEANLKAYHAAASNTTTTTTSSGGSTETDAAAEQQPVNKMIFEMPPTTPRRGVPTAPSPWTSVMTARKFAHATSPPSIPGAPTGADAHEDDVCEVPVGDYAAAFDEPQSEKCSAIENDNSDDGGGDKDKDEDARGNDDDDNGTRNRTDGSNNGKQYDDNDYENDNDENGDNGDNNDKSNDYDHDAGNNGNDENHYGWTMDRATSLKVGEVLRRKMYSPDGTFAAWPGMDGSIMFGRYPTTPPPEDDGYSLREMDLITTLHRSDHAKVWRALDLRAELQKEEKDKAEGLPQETRHGAWWKCLHWGRPSARERERARQNMGEIAMSIDDRAGLVSRWASRVCCL